MGETPSLCSRVGAVMRVDPRIRHVAWPECRRRRRPDGLPRQERRAAGPQEGRGEPLLRKARARRTAATRVFHVKHPPMLTWRKSATVEVSTARSRIDELQNTVTVPPRSRIC